MQATEVDTFDILAGLVRASFATAVAAGGGKFFTTNVEDLFDLYLSGFADPAERQYHNCTCCRSFLNRYGGLAIIDGAGNLRPAMFGFIDSSLIPGDMFEPARRMAEAMLGARITGVFLSSLPDWGTATTGEWNHFAVTPPNASVYQRGVKTAGQAMAMHREEFAMLRRGLGEFSLQTFTQAVALLDTEALYRSDKFKGVAQALLDLKTAVEGTQNQRTRDLLVWKAVATKPAGFCHVRSSMIGTLLEDLEAGKPFDAVKRSFDAKMNPLLYQRSQVAPAAGNIAQAEKLVASLGLAPSLERRYASVDEVLARAIWVPTGPASQMAAPAAQQPATGVFAGLQAAQPAGQLKVSGPTLTWSKFVATALQGATALEFLPSAGPGSYGAITAAQNPDAPPLFVWDDLAARNPFSWYRWTGVEPQEFGLTCGVPVRVAAIVPVPAAWNGPTAHEGVLLLLDGAADKNAPMVGLGLFPELIRNELREVRSTINAHSAKGTLGAAPGAQAVGMVLRKTNPIGIRLRVTTRGAAVDYAIDRWD